MEHKLLFKDSKSDKFWNIKVTGKSFTVTYGKTGTTGTSQTKNFDSKEKCLKEAEKLFNEKIKKGYKTQKGEAQKVKLTLKPEAQLDKEKIISLLKSRHLADVEKGIEQLGKFAKKKKSHDNNPLYKFFELEKDAFDETELIKVPILDSIVATFKNKLSSDSLTTLIQSTMGLNIDDNFLATIKAVQIAIDRKDVPLQKAIVESFKTSCEYYDAGHRYHETTVQDQLIDTLFPQFEGEPLVNLLTWCKKDYLRSDRMDTLFKPAFKKIKSNTALEGKLLKFFIDYLEDCDAEYKRSGILDGFDEASEMVKSAIKEASGDKSLEKLLMEYHRKGNSESKQYNIVVSLRAHNHPRAIQLLMEAMEHERSAVVREAIYSLGHLKAEEAVSKIVTKLKSKNGSLITAAAFALSQIKNKECVQALRDEKNYKHALKITKDEEEGEGRFSVGSLQYFDIKSVNNDLLTLLKKHDDFEVQEGAVEALIFRAAEDIIEQYASYIISKDMLEDDGRTLIELILGIASRIDSPGQKHIGSIASILNKLSTADLETLIEEAECPLHDLKLATDEEKKRADNWCRKLISIIPSEEKKDYVKKMLLLS